MPFWKQHFTPTHGIVFLVMWGLFAALTFTVTAMNIPRGPDHYGQVFLATIGTLAGPMPGALRTGCAAIWLTTIIARRSLPRMGGRRCVGACGLYIVDSLEPKIPQFIAEWRNRDKDPFRREELWVSGISP
jgi:hypothetical protein